MGRSAAALPHGGIAARGVNGRRAFLAGALGLAGAACVYEAFARVCGPPARRILHVAPEGDDGADGGAERPWRTLQAAAARARPGDLVACRAGLFLEHVRFPSRSGGTDDAPIVFESIDGRGAARLQAPDGADNAFRGYGVRNITIRGFEIVGGANGVQFSQAGADFSALCRNIRVENNIIHGARADGVKVSQADNAHVVGNVISACGAQCVDYFNVWGGRIAGNDVSRASVAGAVMVKGGSRDILIEDNWVHDVEAGASVAGIAVGGYSTPGYARPHSPSAEAFAIIVRRNCVERVQGYALSFLGAQRVEAAGNYLQGGRLSARDAPALIGVARGSPETSGVVSRDLAIRANVLAGDRTPILMERPHHDPVREAIVLEANQSAPPADAARARRDACPISAAYPALTD